MLGMNIPFKRRIASVVALVVIAVYGAGIDYSSLVPTDAFGFTKVSWAPGWGGWLMDAFPGAKPEMDALSDQLEKRLGFLPDRDITEFGMFLPKTPDPLVDLHRQAVFFVRGTFTSAGILKSVPTVAEELTSGTLSFRAGEMVGKPAIIGETMMGYFPEENLFCFGSNEVIVPLVARGGNVSSTSWLAQAAESSSYFFFDVRGLQKKIPDLERELAGLPMHVQGIVRSLERIAGWYASDSLSLELTYPGVDEARMAATAFDLARNQALLQIETAEKKLLAQSEDVRLLELIGDWRSQRIMCIVGKQLAKGFTIKAQGAQVTIGMPIPKAWRPESIGPLMPILAVGAAIAVPNFRKAREQARTKACYANIRVILGAVEMYNMDHQVMKSTLSDPEVQAGGVLVRMGYLKYPVTKPELGCCYNNIGDISTVGRIACKVHGTVE